MLRQVVELLHDSLEDVSEDDRLRQAQGLLDAAGLTSPTGRIRDGIYDERGELYKLPKHVISDPINMVRDTAERHSEDLEKKEGFGTLDGADETDEDGLVAKREEKGKGRAGNPIQIRARLSDRGHDVMVNVGDAQTVKAVAAKVQEAAEVWCPEALLRVLLLTKVQMSATSKIKLAYMGKVLKENDTLLAQGWQVGHVVSVLVFEA